MIEVPKPIYDITGGDNAGKCFEIWRDYVLSISEIIQENSGVKDLGFFYKMHDIKIHNRQLTLDGNIDVVTDDGLSVLVLDEWPIAQMNTFRDDGNYHRIVYSHTSEKFIAEVSQKLRKKYQGIFNEEEFYAHFHHNNS